MSIKCVIVFPVVSVPAVNRVRASALISLSGREEPVSGSVAEKR